MSNSDNTQEMYCIGKEWQVSPKSLTSPFYSVLKHGLRSSSWATVPYDNRHGSPCQCFPTTAQMSSLHSPFHQQSDGEGIHSRKSRNGKLLHSKSFNKGAFTPSDAESTSMLFQTLALYYSPAYCLGGPIKLVTETEQFKCDPNKFISFALTACYSSLGQWWSGFQ